jgi:hypothetical protein
VTEEDWKVLLPRIRDGKCTPFLGAGVNYGILPLGGQIASEWAREEKFPLRSADDLAAVAQFLAVKYNDRMHPKDRIIELLQQGPKPDFSQRDDPRLECLRALAELPLPIYLTTNYDDLMVKALAQPALKKEPRRDFCRWHGGLKSMPPVIGGSSRYEPDYAHPLVFHLHGSDEHVESLVLTEDDYLDFLVNISRNQKLLPPRIQRSLTDASLLFIGYRLRDINFRVIYRGLVQSMDGSLRRLSVTVQLKPPEDHGGDPEAAGRYLSSYFEDLNVTVYWGTASEFAQELRDHWRDFCGRANP